MKLNVNAQKKLQEWQKFLLDTGWTKENVIKLSDFWISVHDEYGNLKQESVPAETSSYASPDSSGVQTAGQDIDIELDGEFRMAISHMMLGYECNMERDDFDKMITICANITKTYMKKEHKCAGCDTIIYHQSYCGNCRRLLES